jgi:hypothetical protein
LAKMSMRPLGRCCRFLPKARYRTPFLYITTTMGRFEGGPFCFPVVAGDFVIV